MSFCRDRLRRGASVASGLLTLLLLMVALLWPLAVAETLRSRLAVLLIAVWSGGFACWLHPNFGSGLAHGFRAFQKETDVLTRKMRGDDDDDQN